MDLRRWRWDESSSLGVAEIDSDHRRFSLLLQDLDNAIAAGGSGPDIEPRLWAIALDALGHFESENRLFEKCEYPERARHARAHEEIRQILKEQVLRESSGADEAGSRSLLSAEALKTLLVSHLLYEDLPFCEFLKSRLG